MPERNRLKIDATVILFIREEGAIIEAWFAGPDEYDEAVENGYLLEKQYDPPRPLPYRRIAFARVEGMDDPPAVRLTHAF